MYLIEADGILSKVYYSKVFPNWSSEIEKATIFTAMNEAIGRENYLKNNGITARMVECPHEVLLGANRVVH
jgi:hypothetical protein